MQQKLDTHSKSNQGVLVQGNAQRPSYSTILKKRKFSEAINFDESSSSEVSECFRIMSKDKNKDKR